MEEGKKDLPKVRRNISNSPSPSNYHNIQIQVNNTEVNIGQILPSAQDLEKLEGFAPGITNKLLDMAKQNMPQRHYLEKQELELLRIEQRNDFKLNRNGQLLFALLIFQC